MPSKKAEKVEVLKVNLNDLEAPIKRVEVAESTIKKNPDAYHQNLIQAKQYAKNEADYKLKSKMDADEYRELLWTIENFR